MKRVVIYTDGACSGNPGVGGWGAVLIYGEAKKEISGAEKMTTNNRMELTAAIKALELLREPCEVELYTDSAYLCNGFNNGWIWNWLKNGWKTASGKPVENRELWERLLELQRVHKLDWRKVKGMRIIHTTTGAISLQQLQLQTSKSRTDITSLAYVLICFKMQGSVNGSH